MKFYAHYDNNYLQNTVGMTQKRSKIPQKEYSKKVNARRFFVFFIHRKKRQTTARQGEGKVGECEKRTLFEISKRYIIYLYIIGTAMRRECRLCFLECEKYTVFYRIIT